MKISLPHLLSSSLTLMVAACTPGLDISATPVQVESTVLSLPSSAPKSEQRLVLVASVKEGKQVRIGGASLVLEVDHSWQGLKRGTSEVIPWFRVRIVDERDGSVYEEQALLANDIHAPNPMRLYGLDRHLCEQAEARCEVPFRIEIERQGPPAEGTLNVHWKATGYANADEAEGSNLEVRLVLLQEP